MRLEYPVNIMNIILVRWLIPWDENTPLLTIEFTVPDGKPFGKGGGNMSYNSPGEDGFTDPTGKGIFNRLPVAFAHPAELE